jgi:hypothetical protein
MRQRPSALPSPTAPVFDQLAETRALTPQTPPAVSERRIRDGGAAMRCFILSRSSSSNS